MPRGYVLKPTCRPFWVTREAPILAASPRQVLRLRAGRSLSQVARDLSIAFLDPEWGAATSRQALDQGADVIFGAGGNTGNGAIQEIAADPGAGATVFCIGVDADQWFTVPAAQPCLVSSAMKLITPSVHELIAASVAGEFPGGNYFGDTGLAPFHDHDGKVPQEVKDLLAGIKAGFDEGTLETGYGQ